MPLVAQSSLLNEYPVSRRFLGLARALEVFSQGLVSGAVRRIDLECSAQPAKTVFAETILQKDHANFVPQRRIVRVFHHVLDELVHPLGGSLLPLHRFFDLLNLIPLAKLFKALPQAVRDQAVLRILGVSVAKQALG